MYPWTDAKTYPLVLMLHHPNPSIIPVIVSIAHHAAIESDRVNCAPVLTLWTATTPTRLGHPSGTALTLGPDHAREAVADSAIVQLVDAVKDGNLAGAR